MIEAIKMTGELSVPATTERPRHGAAPRGRASAWLLLLLLSAGCGSTGIFSPAGRVEQLHLIGTPVAVDMDKQPGPDGLGVRVYAGSRDSRAAVRIAEGTLELLLFDGTIRPQEILSSTPIAKWSYTAKELEKHEQISAVGVGYAFVPTWTERRPKSNRVTVVARFTGADGIVYSAPITVPLPSQ